MPNFSDSEEFTVSWSGSDDENGSAIADYTIYVAENGGEFTPWLENTTLTEAVFTGNPGSSYEFYAVAKDNAGNVQDLPSTAQASTAIAGDNNPPVLLNPIGTQVVAEDSNFSLTISEEIFADSDEGDILTYSATLSDGGELPNWLTFDAQTQTFSGIPTNEDLGNLNILVTVSDIEGETASNSFDLIVENVNDAPILNNAIASQIATEDEVFSFTFAEETFSDVDAGDSLTYSAALSDGSELPAWLAFDAETRTFSGTPINEDVGTLNLQVTATDNDGKTATDTFDLEVINVNDVPLDIELSNIVVDENITNGTVIGNLSTVDPDLGDTFSYTLLNDADDRFILDGNELQVASGNSLDFEVNSSHEIEIQTTDAEGLSIAKNFTLYLNDINEAPVIVDDSVTANSSSSKVIPISYLLENDSDPERDSLTLTTVGNAIGGMVSIDGDNVIFTNDGSSSTGSFEYTVSDGKFSNTATVTIDIGVTENGSNSSDTIVGTSGDDSYRGRNGNDSISGFAGDDSIKGENGNDTLDGGIGNDTLDGGNNDDYIFGGLGVDYLIGGEGTDTLDGGEDGDFYLARHNNIDVYSDSGSEGVDVIVAESGSNFNLELGLTFNADSGIEQIDGTAIGNKFEIRANGSNQGNIWDFSNLDLLGVDVINGRKGNDSILGSAGDDSIKGEDGHDTLNGGLGSDTLDGGKHNDTLIGDAGVDYLIGGEGTDRLDGGEDGDFYLARHNNIDIYSDSGTDGMDVILAEGQNNFNLELGLTFNSDSGIEQIDGTAIANKFEIRANGSNQDNIWDFSELDLLGVDVINGRKGNDSILGSAGDDSIKGEDGNDTLNGGIGNDTLDGGKHDDYLLGGAGIDYLIGGEGLDTLDGGKDGDFYLARHNNIDTYSDSGTQGVDVIVAESGSNFNLELGLTFNSDSGIEAIDGTAVANKLEIRANGSNQDNIWDFSNLDLLGVDVINGRKGNDSIIGSMGDDSIKGEDGHDTLNGGLGSDTLDGGKHDDYLLGGAGIDYLIGGEGTDTLDGGEGGDFYLARHNNIDVYSDSGTQGVDVILAEGQNNFNLELGLTFNADSGIEQIDGSGVANKFEIRANDSNQGNTWDFSDLDLLGVDVINGRKGNDSIIGSTGDDSIKGEDGNDTLNGGIGNDTLDGGKHDDYLKGGTGIDYLIGSEGLDTLDGGEDGDFYLARHNNIDVYLDSGTDGVDVIVAESGSNFNLELGLAFNADSGIEQIDGSGISNKLEIRANGSNQGNNWDFSELNLLGVDVINGRKGNDSIIGSTGNDSIKGEDGNDTLNGGLGSDTLNGGNNDDYLFGGLGNDTLIGGKGKDSFVFNSPNEGVDIITDFDLNDDTLVFSAAGFGGNLIAGEVESQMFTIGTAASSDEHRFIYDAGSGDLFYDSDGIGDQEEIKLARLNSGLSLGSNNLSIGL